MSKKIAVIFILIFLLSIIYISNNFIAKLKLINIGYYPLEKTMKKRGYLKNDENVYVAMYGTKEIKITFDFENNTCSKDKYTFSLKDQYKKQNGAYYVNEILLEQILNGDLTYNIGKIKFTETNYTADDWMNYNIVTHAGGSLIDESGIHLYTNTLESLIQNYNMGKRVFEFDLFFTSDNNLAAVHDISCYNYKEVGVLSTNQWKNTKIEGKYTSMTIDDILDEMIINKDIFLITDTKSFSYTEEQTKLQFEIIYKKAMEKDPKLLNRIIPQIYNERMYYIVKSVYNFQNIIYTTYATDDSANNIINFASSKPEIKTIVAMYDDSRFNENEINQIHKNSLKIYHHTINFYPELITGINKNIDGFYSDLFLQSDFDAYYNLLKN